MNKKKLILFLVFSDKTTETFLPKMDDEIDFDPGFKGMSQVYITKGVDLVTKNTVKTRRNPNEIARDEIKVLLKTSKSYNLAEKYMRSIGENLHLYNPKIFAHTVEYILKIEEGNKKSDTTKLNLVAKGDLNLAADIIRYKKIFEALN